MIQSLEITTNPIKGYFQALTVSTLLWRRWKKRNSVKQFSLMINSNLEIDV